MMDIVERLREMQEDWAAAIKRMDSNVDNGLMTSIRFEQYDTFKLAADTIQHQAERIRELEAKMAVMGEAGTEIFENQLNRIGETTVERDEARQQLSEVVEYAGKLRDSIISLTEDWGPLTPSPAGRIAMQLQYIRALPLPKAMQP